MNDEITKEEMVKILKETIFYLKMDKSDPYHDIRDYESLNNEDYESIADDLAYYVNELLMNRRKQKLEKIMSKI